MDNIDRMNARIMQQLELGQYRNLAEARDDAAAFYASLFDNKKNEIEKCRECGGAAMEYGYCGKHIRLFHTTIRRFNEWRANRIKK